MSNLENVIARLRELNEDELERVRGFIESLVRERAPAAWSFDFLAHFAEASQSASRDVGGMEIRVAEATCAGTSRPALWEHPPVSGSASVGYLVPIPSGLRALKLKFAIGIRDGAELPRERFIAFRVLVNGFKFWSTVKHAHEWEEHNIVMPQLGSDVARIEFVTDGLGDNRWNWAVWGTPRLEAE